MSNEKRRQTRTVTADTIFRKVFKTFDFTGIWKKAFGTPEKTGFWIIYGNEKNGKTWMALLLALYLSAFEKVLYVSAEEGISENFKSTMKRIGGFEGNKRVHFMGYEELEDLELRIKKRQAPRIVFIDNTTFYDGELTKVAVKKMIAQYPDKLFVFLAHEDKGEPSGAVAKLIKKYAMRVIRIEGLTAFIGGRTKGGVFTIDEKKASLYHGTEKLTQ